MHIFVAQLVNDVIQKWGKQEHTRVRKESRATSKRKHGTKLSPIPRSEHCRVEKFGKVGSCLAFSSKPRKGSERQSVTHNLRAMENLMKSHFNFDKTGVRKR